MSAPENNFASAPVSRKSTLKKAKKAAWYLAILFSALSTGFNLVGSLSIPALSQIAMVLSGSCYLIWTQFLLGQTLTDEELYRDKLEKNNVGVNQTNNKMAYLKENYHIVSTGIIAGILALLSLVNPLFSIAAGAAFVVNNVFSARAANRYHIHIEEKGPASTRPLDVAFYTERCLNYKYSTYVSRLLLANSINLLLANVLMFAFPPLAPALTVYMIASSGAILLAAVVLCCKAKYHALNAHLLHRELAQEETQDQEECSTPQILNTLLLEEQAEKTVSKQSAPVPPVHISSVFLPIPTETPLAAAPFDETFSPAI